MERLLNDDDRHAFGVAEREFRQGALTAAHVALAERPDGFKPDRNGLLALANVMDRCLPTPFGHGLSAMYRYIAEQDQQ